MMLRSCEEYRVLLMGYLDGELDATQRAEVEKHIHSCADCSAERGSYENLNRMVQAMNTYTESERALDRYWQQTWNRAERGIGWFLFGAGAILLTGYGVFEASREFWTDPTVPLIVRIGAGAGGLGVLVLLVSLVRERLMLRKKERYTEVER
ncbi:MAG: zf-HC2 domain-containing protein [Candidatus Latescibacterota bacterium]|nr:MAG: zf-HC2 domain-containing protein [Candidatus Latescibacterota bacterium]